MLTSSSNSSFYSEVVKLKITREERSEVAKIFWKKNKMWIFEKIFPMASVSPSGSTTTSSTTTATPITANLNVDQENNSKLSATTTADFSCEQCAIKFDSDNSLRVHLQVSAYIIWIFHYYYLQKNRWNVFDLVELRHIDRRSDLSIKLFNWRPEKSRSLSKRWMKKSCTDIIDIFSQLSLSRQGISIVKNIVLLTCPVDKSLG